MLDSISAPIILDIINNQWSDKQKSWTKDFTFYDNVTTLSLDNTAGSLPSVIGGYPFSMQNQVACFLNDYSKEIKIDTTPWNYYRDQALAKTKNQLKQINMTYMDIENKFFVTEKSITESAFSSYKDPNFIPIINVSIYRYIPYLLKNNLTSTRDVTKSFGWNTSILNNQWILSDNQERLLQLELKQTSKPEFTIFVNQGLHEPHSSPTSPITIEQASTVEDMNIILTHQLSYATQNISIIIDFLKNHKIYDNTRIIVTTDHGTQQRGYGELLRKYLRTITTPMAMPLNDHNIVFSDGFFSLSTLPAVFIMDKNFNTTSAKNMQMDSRFLSVADLNGTILNTFIKNHSSVPDYLVTTPPKRAFNIPYLEYGVTGYMNQSSEPWVMDSYSNFIKYIKTNSNTFIKISDVKTGQFEIFKYGTDIADITNIPSIEYLE